MRITDWVYRQLCHCTTPIHPITAPLIEAFVQSVIVPASRSDSINDPISEQELSTVFSDLCVPSQDENGSKRLSFTTQLLLVYYVLLYEDTLLSNMSSIGKFFLHSFRIRSLAHVTNDKVRRRTYQPPATHLIMIRRLCLFGHIARAGPFQDHSRALRAAISHLPVDWQRPPGRPRRTWLRTIELDLQQHNLGLNPRRGSCLLYTSPSPRD